MSCWIRGAIASDPASGERRGDQSAQASVVGRVGVEHVPEQARGHARRQLVGERAAEQTELLDDVRVGQHRAYVRVARDQPPGVAARQRDPHGRACRRRAWPARRAAVGVRGSGEQRGGRVSMRRRSGERHTASAPRIGTARIGEALPTSPRGRGSAPPPPPRGATARRAGPGSRRRGCRRSVPTARAGPRSRRWSARRRSARGRRPGGGSGPPGARGCPRCGRRGTRVTPSSRSRCRDMPHGGVRPEVLEHAQGLQGRPGLAGPGQLQRLLVRVADRSHPAAAARQSPRSPAAHGSGSRRTARPGARRGRRSAGSRRAPARRTAAPRAGPSPRGRSRHGPGSRRARRARRGRCRRRPGRAATAGAGPAPRPAPAAARRPRPRGGPAAGRTEAGCGRRACRGRRPGRREPAARTPRPPSRRAAGPAGSRCTCEVVGGEGGRARGERQRRRPGTSSSSAKRAVPVEHLG